MRAILDKHLYEYGQTDFGPVITKFLAKKPDYVDTGTMEAHTTGYFLKQIREAGYTGLIGAANSPDPETIIEIGGEYAEGYLMFGLSWREDDPFTSSTTKKFVKEYIARFGKYNPGATNYIDNANILLQSIKQAGTVNVRKVADKMHNLKYRSTAGGPEKTQWAGKQFYGIDNQYIHPIFIWELGKDRAKTIQEITGNDIIEALRD